MPLPGAGRSTHRFSGRRRSLPTWAARATRSWSPGPVTSRIPAACADQFGHVNDIAPTIYELAHVQAPNVVNGVKQAPLEGTSLVYSLDSANAPSRHRIQYFETLGSRGIYKDGWWAGSFNHMPWQIGGLPDSPSPETNSWELYNLEADYSQAHNVAAENPEKLKELVQLFDSEAKRNNVYPLEPHRSQQPALANGRTHFVYHSGVQRIAASSAPWLGGRGHVITADVEIPANGADGVIVAQAGAPAASPYTSGRTASTTKRTPSATARAASSRRCPCPAARSTSPWNSSRIRALRSPMITLAACPFWARQPSP